VGGRRREGGMGGYRAARGAVYRVSRHPRCPVFAVLGAFASGEPS